MAESLGEAVLELDVDSGGLTKGMAAAETSVVGRFKGMAGKARGLMAGGMAAAGAAVVGVGVAAYKLGQEFDKAYDNIRVGTGATGKTLDGLKADFRDVVSSVPTDFESASTAIADLNTRLGLSGPQLRERAKQFLELSRITGTDVATNIEAVSKAFVDWEVPVKDQGKTLDGFFRISQATGISVSDLAGSVQAFGSPLRQLGYGLDEAASMFGIFEKAGVNTETMVPGLKQAVSNLSQPTSTLAEKMDKLGISVGKPDKALREVMALMTDESIPAAERTGLAMDVFGRRAGADMAEAISQGRFELGDMLDVFHNGSDTILQAGKDTRSASESFQVLKNKAFVALEPIAIRVFDAVSTGIQKVLDFSDRLESEGVDAFGKYATALRVAGRVFEAAYNTARNYVEGVLTTMQGAFKVIRGIVDTFVGLVTLDFDQMWSGIAGIFEGGWQIVEGLVQQATAAIRGVFEAFGIDVGDLVGDAWTAVKSVTVDKLADLVGFVGRLPGRATRALSKLPGQLRGKARDGWQSFRQATANVVGNLLTFIRGIPGKAINRLGTLGGSLYRKAKSSWQEFRKGVGEKVSDTLSFVRDLPGKTIARLSTLPGSLYRNARGAWQDFRKGVVEKVGDTVSFVNEVPGKIKNAVGNLGGILLDAGRAVIQGLINGIKSKLGELTSLVGGIAGKIKGLKGPLPKDRVLLVDEGAAIIEGLSAGMRSRFDELRAEIGGFAPTIQADVTAKLPAMPAAEPERTSAARTERPSGPLVSIGEMTVRDAFDEDRFASKLAWRVRMGEG